MSIAIKSGAKVLYQWERGVALTASTPCDILRISREDDRVTDDLYPVISGSTGTALIPDRMLTESGYLHVSRIDISDGSERVLETVRILVRHAAKPQNTASSTKEIGDMQALRMQMAALERAAREGKFDGEDGITPHVGENGNWFAGDVDLGIRAQGEKGDKGDPGDTPYVGANGNWFVGDFDTGVKAKSEDVSLYAEDLYTSGVLVTDDLESFVMTGKTSDAGTPQLITSPGVVYIKGVRRWLNTSRRTYDVRDTDRVQAQYLRLNEATGEIGHAIWHDVTINGDLDNGGEIVDEFTGEVIPKRSGGYYDVILCVATIPAGATEVTPDMIRDLRGDERYCGFVRSKVDGGGGGDTEYLETISIALNETAPVETVSSICDFVLTPMTPTASYCLHDAKVRNGGIFFGHEIPLITTKGTISVINSQNEVITEKRVDALINSHGVSDTFTNKGVHKVWSDRFYFTKEPVSREDFTNINNALYTFEFTEEDFQNVGLPAKLDNIPIASPCFYTEADAVNRLSKRVWGGGVFPATLSWDEVSRKYIFKVRGTYSGYIMAQLQSYTKCYIHYQLETPYDDATTFAMGISSGDKVTFAVDDSDWKQYLDAGLLKDSGDIVITEVDAMPTAAIMVPRNTTDACDGMLNAARMLNNGVGGAGGDATVQGYSWIGEGDGATDYTARLQGKLDEIHTVSNGGTVYLGPGTYPISGNLHLYDNTRLIGDGQTVIKQIADNKHAIVACGNNIMIKDLTITLAGACTNITACVYANSYNKPEFDDYDSNYPTTNYVQNLTMYNVFMTGEYKFGNENGYAVVSDAYNNYKGVGIYSHRLMFNYAHIENVDFKNLFAGVYGGGGSNYFRVSSVFCKYGLYIVSGSDNTYFVDGHSYYANNAGGDYISMSDAIAYVERDHYSAYHLRTYDMQAYKNTIFFGSNTFANKVDIYGLAGWHGLGKTHPWGLQNWPFIDYGRGNVFNSYKKTPFRIGSRADIITRGPYLELSDPVIQNALSGAGVWGNITSNTDFQSFGIDVRDVCRYPTEKTFDHNFLPYVLSTAVPSPENPIELVIDYSNRPVKGYPNYFIQFHHENVAADYMVSFDTTNTGEFNTDLDINISGNTNVVQFYNYPQKGDFYTTYRMRIRFTKALQIENLRESMRDVTFNYNPEGLIGICNIGMTVNDYAGRSFLGECGGSLYGNVDMHQNTLKNLPAPREDGDAVSKAYLERRLAELEESNENGASGGLNITYDGDNESDTHTWVSKVDGNRAFVKVSDIPNGEIDLIGAEVRVLIPEWPHLNYTFTITSEMYSEVSGLTQILYQDTASNDYSPVTMIVICTKAGKYTIALNGWTEDIWFYEPGIYFMDVRSYGGGKYVESLFRSGTDVPEETEENPAEYNGNEIQVFTRGLCIGDSITEGVFNYSGGQTVIKKYSYPSVLKRLTGIDIVNAGVSGLTSKTWYEASINSDTQYGTWVNGEWVWHMSPETAKGDVVSKSLDYSGFDFSVIHLGINDIYTMGEATLDETISTFEANIYNIINKLKAENTGIKVFLATIIPSYAYPGNTDYAAINEKIREIANATENVFLIDLNAYSACLGGTPYHNIHLTALGYNKMATEIKSLICYTIKENLEKFKDVQFIGTDYVI